MKWKWYGKKLVSALCLLLAFGAIPVALGGAFLPDRPWAWLAWPASAAVLAVTAGMLPGRRRVWGGVVGALAYLVAAAFWFPRGLALLLLIPCLLLYWIILRASSTQAFDEWPVGMMVIGMLLYLAGVFVARLMGRYDLLPLLRNLLIAYLPVLLLYANHSTLIVSASARDGSGPPRRIRAGNRWLAIAVSALVLLLANIRAIADAFYTAGNWLLGIVARVVGWLMSLFASEPVSDTGGAMEQGAQEMFGLEAAEPSLFWVILEKVAGVLALVAAVVLAGFALYKLYGLLRKLVARLMARIRQAAQQLGEGVQDRTESILDMDELLGNVRKRVDRLQRRLRRPPRWQDLDSRMRVRRIYAQWMQKHSAARSTTAREALQDAKQDAQAADIYERARYSDLDIEEADVTAMQEAMRLGRDS